MASATYQSIIAAAEVFLKASNSTGPDNSKTNKQIVSSLRSQIADGGLKVDATDGTMLSYLSEAANNDNDSGIVSGGSHGGYWYDPSAKALPGTKPPDVEKISRGKGKEILVYEKDLYPLMELWLEKRGYTAKDMSNLKSGGRWGNPDIIGVDRIDLFGAVEVELASCEVKLSDSNWEQMIFEAISHKRFANRSWFCYKVSLDGTPMPKGMEYYAERYKVGVVQVVLTDDELIEIKNGDKIPLDYIDRVVERVPALYDYVPLREKRDLVDRTGITLTVSF